MMLSRLSQLMSQPSIAVDLGTANTRMYVFGMGKTIEKPSSINVVKDNDIADDYLHYINSKLVFSPLRGGVIVDLKKAIALLTPLVAQTKKFFMSPITLACAPTDTSETERSLLCSALVQSGASRVSVIPEVWAAAIGAGLDLTLPSAQLLIDIGEGVTDLAVFRDGRIIYPSAVRTACADIKKAIHSAIISKHKLKLYDHEVERLSHEIRSMFDQQCDEPQWLTVSGIDIIDRCEKRIKVDRRDVVDAMMPVINKIMEMIGNSLKRIPDHIYCELLESGICLTGGGACISGMDQWVASRTDLAVRVAPDPAHAVINGAMQTLEYWSGKKCWWEKVTWPELSV